MNPPEFPITFKEFLRRAFGGRLYSERLRLFRKYLVTSALSQYVDPHDVAAKTIEKMGQNGICNPDSYFRLMDDIKTWRIANRRQQRREAANSRWTKEKSKKSFGHNKEQQK